MKYIVASTAVTDEIHYVGGATPRKIVGGAGIYALSGIRLWTHEVLLVTGVGADFEELYGDWFNANSISMDGLIVKDPKTPHNVITYFEDGEREEVPLYGLEHYQKIEVTPEELAPYFNTARGIYIFKNSNAEFWDKIIELKKNSAATVMWEIANDATYLENKSKVKEIAEQMDILSINLSESKALLGLEDLAAIVEEFKTWKLKLVFLRIGSRGSIMISNREVVQVPSENVQVVDVTGAGNSSSGAVLYGFCEGYDLATCGRLGSISAAMCISQVGVPENIVTRATNEVK